MTELDIRPLARQHIAALAAVADATGLFPGDALADMAGPALDGTSTERWFVAIRDADEPVAFCYAREEPFANGTWNMLALAVHPEHQRKSAGAALTAALVDDLASLDARILIVDTSSGPDFGAARAFYAAQGFHPEARIRDYWAKGDDKITFWKTL